MRILKILALLLAVIFVFSACNEDVDGDGWENAEKTIAGTRMIISPKDVTVTIAILI